jgi:hypothetical protein
MPKLENQKLDNYLYLLVTLEFLSSALGILLPMYLFWIYCSGFESLTSFSFFFFFLLTILGLSSYSLRLGPVKFITVCYCLVVGLCWSSEISSFSKIAFGSETSILLVAFWLLLRFLNSYEFWTSLYRTRLLYLCWNASVDFVKLVFLKSLLDDAGSE